MVFQEMILGLLSVIITVVLGFFVWVLKRFLGRIETKVNENSTAIGMIEKRQALWTLAFTDAHPEIADLWEKRRKTFEGNPRILEELSLEHLEKVVRGRF